MTYSNMTFRSAQTGSGTVSPLDIGTAGRSLAALLAIMLVTAGLAGWAHSDEPAQLATQSVAAPAGRG